MYIQNITSATFPEQLLRDIVNTVIVKRVSIDNGINGTLSTSYKYEDGLVHLHGHGHLGFAKVTETDDQTGIKTITEYRQDYPYTGEPKRVEMRTSTDSLLAESIVTHHEFTGDIISQQPLFPHATSNVEKSYDFESSNLLSTVTNSMTYDSYGSVDVITVTTVDHTDSNTEYKTVTDNDYDDDDVSKWFLGRLSKTTVTKTIDNGGAITRTSEFEYDVTTGFLVKEITEPGGSFELMKTYLHDVYGNQIKVTTSGNGIAPRDSEQSLTQVMGNSEYLQPMICCMKNPMRLTIGVVSPN